MKGSKFMILGLLFLLVASCSKFEEGNNFSLLSAKARLVNHWDIISYEIDGVNQSITGNNSLQMDFYKDETFKRTWIVAGFPIAEAGHWSFGAKKSILILTKNDGTLELYTIVKLTSKDLKAKRTDDDGKIHVYTFKGK